MRNKRKNKYTHRPKEERFKASRVHKQIKLRRYLKTYRELTKCSSLHEKKLSADSFAASKLYLLWEKEKHFLHLVFPALLNRQCCGQSSPGQWFPPLTDKY